MSDGDSAVGEVIGTEKRRLLQRRSSWEVTLGEDLRDEKGQPSTELGVSGRAGRCQDPEEGQCSG